MPHGSCILRQCVVCLKKEELEISGVSIPRIRIPVKTGRNISVVIEAAAMNYRSKEMGFDATRLFEERLTKLIEKNEVKND